MQSERLIHKAANILAAEGYGMVVGCAFTTDDFYVKCFSTVTQQEVHAVMEATAYNVSLMPFDLSSIMNGDFVVKSPNEKLQIASRKAAEIIEMEEPLISVAIAENMFSVFVIGDAPMITYMAVRIISSMKSKNNLDWSINPSLN